MNFGQSKVQAIQLIKEYSKKGILIDTAGGNYQDYILQMSPLANAAQMEIAQYVKIPSVKSVTQNPIPNLINLLNEFDMAQYLPDKPLSYEVVGAKSYSFEVDRPCTVYIKENGVTLKQIDVIGINKFTNYKGNINSTGGTIRMEFAGSYPYTTRFRALFKYAYATDADVPAYGSFVPYDMPTDYMEFDKIIRWYDQRQLQETSEYLKTEDKKVYINWFLTGQFDIHYFKRPTEITSATLDTYEYEIDPKAHHLIPYYIGAFACDESKSNVKSLLLGEYKTKLSNISNQSVTPVAQQIQNIYGW